MSRLAAEHPRGSRPTREATASRAEGPSSSRPGCTRLLPAGPGRWIAAGGRQAVDVEPAPAMRIDPPPRPLPSDPSGTGPGARRGLSPCGLQADAG